MTTPAREPSALEAALERVGDRWSLLLVDALLTGPHRWSDLLEAVPGIAPNILSDRLRRLERKAVVASSPYSQRPIRVTYELTAGGRELAGVLRLLTDWGAGRPDAGPRHAACGTPMEARWYCSTCGRAVGDDEPGDVRLV